MCVPPIVCLLTTGLLIGVLSSSSIHLLGDMLCLLSTPLICTTARRSPDRMLPIVVPGITHPTKISTQLKAMGSTNILSRLMASYIAESEYQPDFYYRPLGNRLLLEPQSWVSSMLMV